jgi:hypothetical protein
VANTDLIRIAHIEWGNIEVVHLGRQLRFKDCKIWPGGAKEWDWSLTGTRHRPGTQPADIEELLAHQPDVLILSRGMQLVLQTCPETIELVKTCGIEYHVEETKASVQLFNELTSKGRRVVGILHSTC